MRFTPRSYQTIAKDFLKSTPRANLYADMGLGKTATILWLIEELDLDDVLIVAPKRVIENVWPQESELWDEFRGLNVHSIMGTDLERKRHLLSLPRVSCINYDNILWLMSHIEDWPFKTVICDESTRLKGFRTTQGTKRSQALAKVAHVKVQRWINLTGTPNPNGYGDLWGQQWFVDGGQAMGRSFSACLQRWFYMDPLRKGHYRKVHMLPGAQKEIDARLKPTTLAIRTADWFDLAKPIENVLYVDLPAPARREYARMERQFFAQLEGGVITAANAAVKSNKLLQLANGAVYHQDGRWSWVHDEKIEALRSVIEESGRANILLAYHYVSDVERLREVFPDAVEIREPGAVERWNKGEISLLLAHPKSAGHGLNLQHGGNTIVFFGDDWNLEDHLQILERIGPARQKQSGYDRPVFVHHILARNTLDEVVARRRTSKASLMECLLEAMAEPA